MIGDKLKKLRESKRLTIQQLCDHIGININTYKKYERNENDVSTETLIKLADFFRVPADYLLSRSPDYDPLDNLPAEEREKAVLKEYLTLDKATRCKIMSALEAAFYSMQQTPDRDDIIIANTTEQIRTIYVTYYSDPVSAGTGTDLLPNDEPEKQIEVIATAEAEKASFAVRVSGDSMTPTFDDGNIILARECSDVDIGEIGVFEMDGEGYVKEYGGDTLISHNPAYPPIPIIEPLRCAGRVLGKADLP